MQVYGRAKWFPIIEELNTSRSGEDNSGEERQHVKENRLCGTDISDGNFACFKVYNIILFYVSPTKSSVKSTCSLMF